jgi:hypothetical protein
MLSALIGNVFTLKHTCTNAAGAPTDATTVMFIVKPPIGANVMGTFTRHPGVGLYEYDFSATVTGTHKAVVLTTSPASEASTEFYVQASHVTP